jgi:hypothetical protein
MSSSLGLSPRERWQRVLEGADVDRQPWALWRHLPELDFCPEFAAAQIREWTRAGYDLGKINFRSTFCLRDHGVKDRFAGDYLGRPQILYRPVSQPADWYRLQVLDVKGGVLGACREMAERILHDAPSSLPILVPVFSPLSQAMDLAGPQWDRHGREAPQAVLDGLAALTASTEAWMKSFSGTRIDGWFYIVKEAADANLPSELAHAGHAANRRLLAAHPHWLDTLHVHGTVGDFSPYLSYPATILHWDPARSGITRQAVADSFPGIAADGISWPEGADSMTLGTSVKKWLKSAGSRSMLSAECVIPYRTPWPVVDSIRAQVERNRVPS